MDDAGKFNKIYFNLQNECFLIMVQQRFISFCRKPYNGSDMVAMFGEKIKNIIWIIINFHQNGLLLFQISWLW